jgi:prefoldin subunit 5
MIMGGNKMELKRKTAEMLIAFMDIFQNEKEIIDVTYEEIQDRIFKMRETEKHMHTDKLKNMTDELRDTDTMLKGIGLGMYSKGNSKGLKNYDATYYDEEQELSDKINVAEKTVRNKNKRRANDYGASENADGNMDDLGEDFLAQQNIADTINGEVFDLNNVGENFYDGDDGYGDEDTGFDN